MKLFILELTPVWIVGLIVLVPLGLVLQARGLNYLRRPRSLVSINSLLPLCCFVGWIICFIMMVFVVFFSLF